MLDTARVGIPVETRTTVSTKTSTVTRGPRTRLELELRVLAEDMAGRLDRDELSRLDEERVADALDAAVAAAMPVVIETLDRELTPRLEALPVHTRLVMARARRRLEFGVD